MRLSKLPAGARFVIKSVALNGEVGRRLADMGFTGGQAGEVVRKELFGGPEQVKIMGYDLLLRESEAKGIEVESTK
jgi:ferrous iron transport protein B